MRRSSQHRSSPRRYPRWITAAASVAITTIALIGGMEALPSSAEREKEPAGPAPGSPTTATAAVALGSTGPIQIRPGQLLRKARQPSRRLPPGSGEGRRVVFSQNQQRVWLVRENGGVRRSYLVSGSIYDNLAPGTYQVYSRSRHAWSFDGNGTMEFFVRFAQGENAAIGFHDIPESGGRDVQTEEQLGTPQSHGCIRQRQVDAKALWRFAQLNTTVVVV